MAHEARLFTVHGRVQGVWFRDSTRREAERLAIAGHAINLPDGKVEVLACGSPERDDLEKLEREMALLQDEREVLVIMLRELETWLHSGPPLASVSRVESVVVEATAAKGFRIG